MVYFFYIFRTKPYMAATDRRCFCRFHPAKCEKSRIQIGVYHDLYTGALPPL